MRYTVPSMRFNRIVRGGCTGEPPSFHKLIPAAVSSAVAFLIRLAKRVSRPGSGPKLIAG